MTRDENRVMNYDPRCERNSKQGTMDEGRRTWTWSMSCERDCKRERERGCGTWGVDRERERGSWM